jgi:hypothetical protein
VVEAAAVVVADATAAAAGVSRAHRLPSFALGSPKWPIAQVAQRKAGTVVQRNRYRQQRSGRPTARRAHSAVQAEPALPRTKSVPIVYGKAVVVLEDDDKNTFFFENGAWIPYGASIAECRRDCLVQALPQKVKLMTRYEIRRPVESAE